MIVGLFTNAWPAFPLFFLTINFDSCSYSRCDADPAALAKYVVALVKKDKPISELKAICIDQLEVFLSNGKDLSNY